MTTVTHDFNFKNDGHPRTHNAMEIGLNEAMVKFHEAGHYNFSEITIRELPCDDPAHYPDICWHYRYEVKS